MSDIPIGVPGPSTDGNGDEAPLAHPALAGREGESAALADAVRRLIELCGTTTASPEATMAAAHGLNAISDALERHGSDIPETRTFGAERDGLVPRDLARHMPYDVVVGRHNPLAVPLTASLEPPKSILEGTFTAPYEGPPGCVHGGVLAASFDLVLAAANVAGGYAGPTVRLEITYRRPTALHEPCRFEGEVAEFENGRVRTVGTLTQRGRVTVEATGEFKVLDREGILRMARRAARVTE
ncbi:hotdog domain-containing protein [Actinomadura sp. DC4]|uniref:PaaI family thioesterase n=1 Tax=Actinomadura sp. DC4 TaxID=3055069 RepID=UPI0025B01953|nr:hotdog domain-containing protein [Actinomadura sp. DC4]MDN3357598.1 hotdog domain-containing protein [Actinomadura sp. DC4]